MNICDISAHEVRYTPEQFVLMAASVDYQAGKKMKALHEMLAQAATTERQMQDIRAQPQRTVTVAELEALVADLESLDEGTTEWQIAFDDASRSAARKIRALIDRAGGGV